MNLTTSQIDHEQRQCYHDKAYAICRYHKIFDPVSNGWIHFDLWPAQLQLLDNIDRHKKNVALKARQEGISWLLTSYIIHEMAYNAPFTALMFSRRDTEAMYLLGLERLKGTFYNLPKWQQAEVEIDSGHKFMLSNGSVVTALNPNVGQGYVANFVFVDEMDFVFHQNKLMRAVTPTIEMGGKIVLVSTSNKDLPKSRFKRIIREARRGNDWHFGFLPWHAHPGRDQAWYEAKRDELFKITGSHDELYEHYPATPEQALAARVLDKRIPHHWLERIIQSLQPQPSFQHTGQPAIPELRVYIAPQAGETYLIGVDPAEGHPGSNDSALQVLSETTGQQCCVLNGKFEAGRTLGDYVRQLSMWYNNAKILVERNNHGHTTILWLSENFNQGLMINGTDGRMGWQTNVKSKTEMYNILAEAIRDEEITLYDDETVQQVGSIDGNTLSAPQGMDDDLADSLTLAVVARKLRPPDLAHDRVQIPAANFRSANRWRK